MKNLRLSLNPIKDCERRIRISESDLSVEVVRSSRRSGNWHSLVGIKDSDDRRLSDTIGGERTIRSSEIGDGDIELRISGYSSGDVKSESVSNDIKESSSNRTCAVGSSSIKSSEGGSG